MRSYENLDAELDKAIEDSDVDAIHAIMDRIGEIHKANCEELDRVMGEERITSDRRMREAMRAIG